MTFRVLLDILYFLPIYGKSNHLGRKISAKITKMIIIVMTTLLQADVIINLTGLEKRCERIEQSFRGRK